MNIKIVPNVFAISYTTKIIPKTRLRIVVFLAEISYRVSIMNKKKYTTEVIRSSDHQNSYNRVSLIKCKISSFMLNYIHNERRGHNPHVLMIEYLKLLLCLPTKYCLNTYYCLLYKHEIFFELRQIFAELWVIKRSRFDPFSYC